MSKFRLEYFGTRGSIPAPGKDTVEFGGNTTCILIEAENEAGAKEVIVIDCGTGIRLLGQKLLAEGFGQGKGKMTLLITHTHWDHIQGFPFFTPAYIPGNTIDIIGHASDDKKLSDIFTRQQAFENFPVPLSGMNATISFQDIQAGATFDVGPVKIKTIGHSHPGGALGFAFEMEGTRLVICTDVEHIGDMAETVKGFAEGADLLAYDSQYYPDEYETKKGWGHSIKEVAIDIAQKAGVKELHLIHHDPLRTDSELRAIEKEAKSIFGNVWVAKEGLIREFNSQVAV